MDRRQAAQPMHEQQGLDHQPLPLALTIAMIAAWAMTMLAIKFYVAPAIVHEWGWIGVIGTLIALFALAKWLDRN